MTDKNLEIESTENENNHKLATIGDVERMITRRLHLFHDALVTRGQIKPVPLAHDLHPKVKETG